MAETQTYVTQSKYFAPAFNAAIFDGPIRIYFAQYQEAQALKLYYNLQARFGDVRRQARGLFKDRGRNIFVMIYPSEEIFDRTFGGEEFDDIVEHRLNSDYVLGVRGPLEDELFDTLCGRLERIVLSAQPSPALEPTL